MNVIFFQPDYKLKPYEAVFSEWTHYIWQQQRLFKWGFVQEATTAYLPHHTSNFIKIILFRKRLIYEKISPLIYHQTNRPSKSRGAKKANLQTKTYFLRLKKLQQQPNLIWWRYLHTTFYYNFLQKVKQIFEFILASICHHKIQFYF